MQHGGGIFTLLMAKFISNFSEKTTCMAINKLCSSGLEAIALAAAKIKLGFYDIAIAGGIEVMS